MNNRLMIVKAAQKGGYFLNGHYVLLQNWDISKHKFTKEEQEAFEEFVPEAKETNN